MFYSVSDPSRSRGGGAMPACPGPVLVPSVSSRMGPGRAETDFLPRSSWPLLIRRVLRRGSQKGAFRRCQEGNSTPSQREPPFLTQMGSERRGRMRIGVDLLAYALYHQKHKIMISRDFQRLQTGFNPLPWNLVLRLRGPAAIL